MSRLVLGSNISSLFIQRQIDRTGSQIGQSLERLSSGMRINHAVDDAAGLSQASKLNADSRVFSQAVRNLNDSISALNIADGTLGDLSNILARYKEIAQQSANGSLTSAQRTSLDTEGQALQSEWNRLVASTKFNNQTLLDGNLTNFVSQLGYSNVNTPLGQKLGHAVSGDGTFTSGSAQGSTTRTAIAVGDINGDGLADNVSASAAAGVTTLYIQIANGDGTFTETSQTRNGTGSAVYGIGLIDQNGDGVQDVVTVSSIGNSAKISTFLGQGNGTFAAGVNSSVNLGHAGISIIPAVTSVAFGDVGSDGKSDVIIGWTDLSDASEVGFQAYTAGAAATYTAVGSATTYPIGGSINMNLSLADFNGDGKLDIVDYNGDQLEIRTGTGSNTFNAATAIAAGGTGVIASGDVNGDGAKDFIVGGTVYTNNGSGAFTAGSTYGTPGTSYAALVDVTGDGYLDYITNTQIFKNDGSGNLSTWGTHSQSSSTYKSVFGVGDVNGDGVSDIVAIQSSDTKIHAQIQSTAVSSTMSRIDITTQTNARTALTTLDTWINRVALEQAVIGSSESRFSSSLNQLSVARENYQAAYSQIMDADIASETANLLSNQIKNQTSTALLAQANQTPAIVLSLLK